MSSHITHSHTIHFKKSHKDSGFTLIELLVVISIIALLSTIVLAVVQDARVKARNTAKNNLVLEYVKALELYRSDTGTYPLSSITVPVCIGYPETPLNTSDNCYIGLYNGLNSLNTAIATHIKGDISHNGVVMYGTNNLNGVQYKCVDATCNSYQLIWWLEKQISNCISNAAKTPLLENTYCAYTKL
jgi:prepilin-type N-terminal cleavage/methylation domain-containing protein